MFHKDKGAHFTHNLGVGLMRTSALFFLAAMIYLVVFIIVKMNTVQLDLIDEVTAEVKDVNSELRYLYEYDNGSTIDLSEEEYNEKFYSSYDERKHLHSYAVYFVTFEGTRSDGSRFELTEQTTRGQYDTYYNRMYQPALKYNMFSIKGVKDPYITGASLKNSAAQEYCACHEGNFSYMTLWGMWGLLLISAILFLIGRKQINISLKYPRSDVPLELSGVPEAVQNNRKKESERFRRIAERMYREQMSSYMNRLPEKSDDNE